MIDSTLKNAKILIVDDKQSNIDVLTGLLDAKGFKSYVATKDSRQVMTLFEEFKPDILLLDLNLPFVNGFEVMEQLNDNIRDNNNYLPILILTADVSQESKQKALTSGASDFLTIPFDLIEADIRINNLLKSRYLYQQLENQNQLLEEMVKERTKELENKNTELIAAKEKAEVMTNLKSNFLANMSHELRTPLVGINGFADFLRQELVNPELKFMAENIYISGSRLSETLNLILDLSLLESGKMVFKFQMINIVSVTEEIISLFKEAALKKNLSLVSSFNQPALFINADERGVRSIITNLINNAIKYTKEGGITINISLKDSFVELKVKDSGIGIAEEYHKAIFEEFRQVSVGFSRNFEGTGLGLNITKKLVEKFGGAISVDSELGKGSTFIVTLPLTINGEKKEQGKVLEKSAVEVLTAKKSAKPVVLLVDDDPFVYMVVKKYTEGQIELETTMNGELAIELCKQKQFAIIFMDINFGRGIDGKQATRAIRKLKGYKTIPIIATTAYAMGGDKEEFMAAGCTHYLSKPFDQQGISELLQEILA
jgi:two-component system, sensor histidine kinase and response regulator